MGNSQQEVGHYTPLGVHSRPAGAPLTRPRTLNGYLQVLIDFFTGYGYFAVFFVLLICGFGVPIPEDITLVAGGVISGLGYTNEHVMFAVGMAGVLAGDAIMFTIGRVYGKSVLKLRFVARTLTPERFVAVAGKI